MKCESWRDLQNMMLEEISKQYRDKVSVGELSKKEYGYMRKETDDKSQELWQQLLIKNEKFFKKDGYLDIEYLSDKNIYRRVPLKRGRPKEEKNKEKRITVRLAEAEEKILKEYCQTNNISESEAIRKGIRKLRCY